MSYNNTGIPLASQFNLRSSLPLDSRFVIENESQWKALFDDDAVYPSMEFALLNDINVNGVDYSRGFYRIDMERTPRLIEEADRKITAAEVDNLFEEQGG